MRKAPIKVRIWEYAITLLVILTLNFFLPRLMPGDPFLFLTSDEGGQFNTVYSQEQIEYYRSYYGLDKPLPSQYLDYIMNLLRGNMGESIYFKKSVVTMIMTRLPWTIFIVMSSLFLSCLLGTMLGCFSAWNREKIVDKFLFFKMIGFSEIPSFLIGLILLFVFAAKLRWFPLSGGITTFARYQSTFEYIGDIIHHAVLPITALTLTRIGQFYFLSRNSMITVLSKDYMRTAWAKGLGKVKIIFSHALKNALLPIVTRVFLSLGSLFGGAILVENVFNYPGVGRLLQESVMARDYILLQGIVLFIAFTVLTMNLLADLVYRKLDPKVR